MLFPDKNGVLSSRKKSPHGNHEVEELPIRNPFLLEKLLPFFPGDYREIPEFFQENVTFDGIFKPRDQVLREFRLRLPELLQKLLFRFRKGKRRDIYPKRRAKCPGRKIPVESEIIPIFLFDFGEYPLTI